MRLAAPHKRVIAMLNKRLSMTEHDAWRWPCWACMRYATRLRASSVPTHAIDGFKQSLVPRVQPSEGCREFQRVPAGSPSTASFRSPVSGGLRARKSAAARTALPPGAVVTAARPPAGPSPNWACLSAMAALIRRGLPRSGASDSRWLGTFMLRGGRGWAPLACGRAEALSRSSPCPMGVRKTDTVPALPTQRTGEPAGEAACFVGHDASCNRLKGRALVTPHVKP